MTANLFSVDILSQQANSSNPLGGSDFHFGSFNKVIFVYFLSVHESTSNGNLKLCHVVIVSLLDIQSLASFNTNLSASIVGPQTLQLQNGQQPNLVSVPGNHRENGVELIMEDGSPLTESSADGDTDEKNQMVISFKYVISKCLVFKGLLVEGKMQ